MKLIHGLVSLWSLVSKILKEPKNDEIIYKLLAEDRPYWLDEEDLVALRWRAYAGV